MGQFFLGMCHPLASERPYPIIEYSVPVIDSILVTFGQICHFRDPNLVTFYLCTYLLLNKEHFTFHLQYKHSGAYGC